MLKLLSFLWSGCFHVWEDLDDDWHTEYADAQLAARKKIVYCRCTKCGVHKTFDGVMKSHE